MPGASSSLSRACLKRLYGRDDPDVIEARPGLTYSLIWLAIFSAAANGGIVKGVVVEQASGKLLSRTQVRLEPVPGSASSQSSLTVRTGRAGDFLTVRASGFVELSLYANAVVPMKLSELPEVE